MKPVKVAQPHPDCEYCPAAERVIKIHQGTIAKALTKIRALDNENRELRERLTYNLYGE